MTLFVVQFFILNSRNLSTSRNFSNAASRLYPSHGVLQWPNRACKILSNCFQAITPMRLQEQQKHGLAKWAYLLNIYPRGLCVDDCIDYRDTPASRHVENLIFPRVPVKCLRLVHNSLISICFSTDLRDFEIQSNFEDFERLDLFSAVSYIKKLCKIITIVSIFVTIDFYEKFIHFVKFAMIFERWEISKGHTFRSIKFKLLILFKSVVRWNSAHSRWRSTWETRAENKRSYGAPAGSKRIELGRIRAKKDRVSQSNADTQCSLGDTNGGNSICKCQARL